MTKKSAVLKRTTLHEYPRPQLVRPQWINLNGEWDFAIDADGAITQPDEVTFGRQKIQVPFAPETPLSGVQDQSYFKAVWYRREIDTPDLADGQRVILHFGAVDFTASVWVNGKLAVQHEGGYTPFFADITDLFEP